MQYLCRQWPRIRRFAECALVWTLCAGLALPGPSFLYAGEIDASGFEREKDRAAEADKAKKEFLKTKILRGEGDSAEQYLFDQKTKELTSMGQLMYNMLLQTRGETRKLEHEQLTSQLDVLVKNIREAGPYSDKKREAVARGLTDIQKRYGSLVKGVTKDVEETDMFSAHLRLNTMFDAMAQKEEQPQAPGDTSMHTTESGTYVLDKDGKLLYKFNKNQVIVFNSRILDSQKAINSQLKKQGTFGMPSDCPARVRESGRFQHDMLLYSWCDQKTKVDGIGKLKRRQRVIQMAALVGHQVTDAELSDDEKLTKLEEQLEKEDITSGTYIPGWAAWAAKKLGKDFPNPPDYIDGKFVQYDKYLGQLNSALDTYKSRIDAFKGVDTVTNEQIEQLRKQEFIISRYMALTQMEALKVQTAFMLETLSYEAETKKRELKDGGGNPVLEKDENGNTVIDAATGKPKTVMIDAAVKIRQIKMSPDSLNYVKTIRSAGLSPERQRQMFEQWHKMAGRFGRLTGVYNNLGAQLAFADSNSKLEKPNQALRAAEAELQVLQRDYSNLMSMPQLKKFALEQSGPGAFEWSELLSPSKVLDRVWTWTPAVTRGTAWALNKASSVVGLDVGGDYLRARAAIDKMTPEVDKVVDLLAEGKYREAALHVVNADTAAHATHIRLGINSRPDDVKLTDKAQAVLAKYQESLMKVQGVHTYTGIPIDIVKWSVALGGLSRVGEKVFLGIGRVGAVKEGAKFAGTRRFFGDTFEQVGLRFQNLRPDYKTNIFKDTSIRILNAAKGITMFSVMIAPIGGSISAIQHYTGGEKSQFKSYTEAVVQGSVHTMQWAAANPWILYFNLPYTAFTGSKFEGAAQSLANRGLVGNAWTGAAKMAQGGTNLFKRFTSKLFGGKFSASTLAETASQRGLLGTLGAGPVRMLEALHNNFLRRPAAFLRGKSYTPATYGSRLWKYTGEENWLSSALEKLATKGRGGAVASGGIGFLKGIFTNIDHVGKFWAFGQTTGYLAHHTGYWLRSTKWNEGPGLHEEDAQENGKDVGGLEKDRDRVQRAKDWFIPRHEASEERNLKRAIADQHAWAESYVWLLLPMHPAPKTDGMRDYQMQKAVDKQYLESADPAHHLKLANSRPQGTEGALPLPLLFAPKIPLFQRIMVSKFGQLKGEQKGHPSEQAIIEAAKKALITEVKNLTGKDPLQSPWKLLDLVKSNDNIGGLEMSRTTRAAIRELASSAFRKNPEHLREILKLKVKDKYKDTEITRELLEDVSMIVRETINSGQGNFDAATVKIADRHLEPYVKSREARAEAIAKFEKAISKLEKEGKRSEDLGEHLEKFSTEIAEWVRLKNADGAHEPYSQLVQRLKKKAAESGLPKGEAEAITTGLDVILGGEKRFHYYNRGEIVVKRLDEAFVAAREKAKQQPDGGRLAREVDAFHTKIQEVLKAEKVVDANGKLLDGAADKAVSTNPGGDAYHEAIKSLSQRVKEISGEGGRAADAKFLNSLVDAVDSAPWLLREGFSYKGWRPVQVESATWMLRSLIEGNSLKDAMTREMVMLKTGGGKTLLFMEFYHPLFERFAATEGRQVLFGVTSKALKAQAEASVHATRNADVIKVTTWSELTTELAQRKVGAKGGKDSVLKANSLDEIFMISDEFDAPFLAPATTIGQQLATIHRISEGLNLIMKGGTRLKGVINGASEPFHTRVDYLMKNLRSHADRLVDHPGHGQLTGRIKEIESALTRLKQLDTKTGLTLEARQAEILKLRQNLSRLIEGREIGGKRSGGLVELAEGLTAPNPFGKTGAEAVGKKIDALRTEIEAVGAGRDPVKALQAGGKIDAALKAVEAVVDAGKGGISRGTPAARTLKAETASLRTRLSSLVENVLGQNKRLTDAAQAVERFEAVKKDPKADARLLGEAEAAMTRALKDIAADIHPTGQRVLADYAKDGAGNLIPEGIKLREMISAPKAEGELAAALRSFAGKRTEILLTSAKRNLTVFSNHQEGIIKSGPASQAYNAQQIASVGRELLAAAENPAAIKPGTTRKPGLIDRLRGRDSVRSEVEEVFAQQQLALKNSKMNTSAQMKELLEVAGRLRRDGGVKLARELETLAKSLGRESTGKQAQNTAERIEGIKLGLEGKANSSNILARLDKIKSSLQVRDRIDGNTSAIRAELDVRKPGWQHRVNELLSERSTLFERAVSKRNAIYETFQRMKDSMAGDEYGFLSNEGHAYAQGLHTKRTLEAPERTADTLRTQAKDMVSAAREVLRHYRRAHASARPEQKAEALSRLNKAREAYLDARANQKVMEAVAEQIAGSIHKGVKIDPDAMPASLRPRAKELLARAEALDKRLHGERDPGRKKGESNALYEMIEEAGRLEIKIEGLEAKKPKAGSPEGVELASLKKNLDVLKSKMEGIQSQVSMENRALAKETLELNVDVAQRRVTEAKTLRDAAETPQGVREAAGRLRVREFELQMAKQLRDLKVEGAEKASIELQALKQTRDANTRFREKLNKEIEGELKKEEGARDADKLERLDRTVRTLNREDMKIARSMMEFQRPSALRIIELAQIQTKTAGEFLRTRMDRYLGEKASDGKPGELARLRAERSALEQQRPAASAPKDGLSAGERAVEAELAAQGSPLRVKTAGADAAVAKLAETAQGLRDRGTPKAVREAAQRFEKSVERYQEAMSEANPIGHQLTNRLQEVQSTAARLKAEVSRAGESRNMPRAQRESLSAAAKKLGTRLEVFESARQEVTTAMEGVRASVRAEPAETGAGTRLARIKEIDNGIRALERLSGPIRSMAGEVPAASRVRKQGKLTIDNNQSDALTAIKREIELDPAKAAETYRKKLDRLTRQFTQELNEAFESEVFLSPAVRSEMGWNINGMWNWIRGIPVLGKLATRHHRSEWVRRELVNLGNGHHKDAADVRFDGLTHKVVPIHQGEWMESMDIGERRWWEMEFKTGLTMPYKHQALVNMRNFITDTPNLPIVGFSGTMGSVLRGMLQGKSGGFKVVGKGSAALPNVGMEIVPSASSRFKLVADSVLESLAQPGKKRVTVVSHANSKDLKLMRKYLLRSGLLSESQISMVFSDGVALGEARPQANVQRQMNLRAIETGEAMVVLLDTRVAGRGLDLPWKKGGYMDVDFYFMDPHKISQVHELQVGGRVDADRLPKGATRRFTRVLDIQSSQRDQIFAEALEFHPFLRDYYHKAVKEMGPKQRAAIAARGGRPGDWLSRHELFMSLPEGNVHRKAYVRLFNELVKEAQITEEVKQLKSSQFIGHGQQIVTPSHGELLKSVPSLAR